MRRCKPLRQLDPQTDHFLLWQRPGPHPDIERRPLYELAHQQVVSVDGIEVVDGLDGRMVQAREDQRLIPESLACDRVIQRSGRQHLDGEVPFELAVVRAVNHTHPARADFFFDAVASQCLADGNGHT